MKKYYVVAAAVALAVVTGALPAAAQRPLGTVSRSGQTVTPVFEGWYENPDGTFSISFGYYNRNYEEVLEILLGSDNFIEPASLGGNQPTHFQPRRHWGVFTVTVPAAFGNREVVWTLKNRGQTFTIPGSLHRDWKIDALKGEAGAGNMPPVLKLDRDGPEGSGPGGITSSSFSASVGKPLTLTVWARDDGRGPGSVRGEGEGAAPVTLTWFKHQGPGDVTFSADTARVDAAGGEMMTTATFGKPGDYVLRVRANDASGVRGAGHAQCCWTNGFVKVTVTN